MAARDGIRSAKLRMEGQSPIRGFRDLDVYKSSYEGAIIIAHQILPKLPQAEKYDLTDQLSRASKAIPRLIAKGYGKKHQKSGFQKYLDDAMTEANETMVCLEQVRDIYHIESDFCTKLVDRYDKIARQIFKFADAWDSFVNRRRRP